MIKIDINVQGTDLTVSSGDLTAGLVGVPYDAKFDAAWDGLQKTVVFSNGKITRNAVNGIVPHEVLAKSCTNLKVGVVGRKQDGTVVIPTIWAQAGNVMEGSSDANDPGLEPDNPVWAQSAALAQKALEKAQDLENRANSGEFDGEPGPPGQEGKPYEHSEEFAALASQVHEDMKTASSAANLAGRNAQYASRSAADAQTAAEAAREAAEQTARDTVPQYALEEAESVIERVQKTRTARSLVLSVMSDFHLTADAADTDSTKQAAVLAGWGLRAIERKIALDGKLFLGDYTNGPGDYTAGKVIADILYARQAIGRSPNEFWCRGNHDLNYARGRDRLLTQGELYGSIDANSLSLETDWSNPGGGYGFRDFPRQKIRLVMLNTCDTAEERTVPAVSSHAPSEWLGIRQMTWLGEHALDLSDKPDPQAWGIVLAGHHPINYSYKVFDKMLKLLEDYQGRKAGKIEYTTETGPKSYHYDFTRKTPARILCALNGHSHNFRTDYVSSGPDVPRWLLRATVPQVMAGRYNECAADPASEFGKKFGEYGPDGQAVYYEKIPGTGKGTSFYVVNIDRTLGELICTCYGAGHDVRLPFDPSVNNRKIVHRLSGCTASNMTLAVKDREPYATKITADQGFCLKEITVTMGGTDITQSACRDGSVDIPAVTGDVVITAAAEEEQFTNLLPLARASDLETIYNGKGWKENTYLSGANEGSRSGVYTTGYIPIPQEGQADWKPGTLDHLTVYIRNVVIQPESSNCRLNFYDKNGAYRGQILMTDTLPRAEHETNPSKVVYDLNGDGTVSAIDPSAMIRYLAYTNKTAMGWIRLCALGMGEQSVITVSEKLP